MTFAEGECFWCCCWAEKFIWDHESPLHHFGNGSTFGLLLLLYAAVPLTFHNQDDQEEAKDDCRQWVMMLLVILHLWQYFNLVAPSSWTKIASQKKKQGWSVYNIDSTLLLTSHMCWYLCPPIWMSECFTDSDESDFVIGGSYQWWCWLISMLDVLQFFLITKPYFNLTRLKCCWRPGCIDWYDNEPKSVCLSLVTDDAKWKNPNWQDWRRTNMLPQPCVPLAKN